AARQDGNANYEAADFVDQPLTVAKATSVITWTPPASITYRTALSSDQLNATVNAPGTLSYSPGPGTVLNAGSGQTLTAAFLPANPNNYNSVTATVSIDVSKASPMITWPNPADITLG